MATTTAPASSQHGPGYGGAGLSFGAKLRAPGFYRAAWLMVLGVAFAFGLTVLAGIS